VPHLEWVVVAGLGVFGFAFAVNSSVHSYLVLAYAGSEKAAEDVGFYYAANALGRFLGTLMSGLLYQWGGLLYALVGSAAMLAVCWLVTLRLPIQRVETSINPLSNNTENLAINNEDTPCQLNSTSYSSAPTTQPEASWLKRS
jgi:predicted lipid-binding transport protein (Tim44 family)